MMSIQNHSTKNDNSDANKQLDTQGLYCPEPVMMLHGAINEVAIGGVVKVLATDPSTVRDIPKFCEFLGHELLAYEQGDQRYTFYVRRLS